MNSNSTTADDIFVSPEDSKMRADNIFVSPEDRGDAASLAGRFGLQPTLPLVEYLSSLSNPVAEKVQILQHAIDHAQEGRDDLLEAGGRRPGVGRHSSSIGVKSIVEDVRRLTAGKPRRVRAASMEAAQGLDLDGDGRISSGEMGRTIVKIAEAVLRKDRMLRGLWVVAVALAVAVVLQTAFGFLTSNAAVRMNKETLTEAGSTSLLTADRLPVSTNVNEIDVSIALFPWTTHLDLQTPRYAQFMSGCEKQGTLEHHVEEVAGAKFKKEEGALLTTTLGTEIKWDRSDAHNVYFTKDGVSWTKPLACEKCTVLNVMMNDQVLAALDKLHEDLGMVLHERGRVLQGGGCGVACDHVQQRSRDQCSLTHGVGSCTGSSCDKATGSVGSGSCTGIWGEGCRNAFNLKIGDDSCVDSSACKDSYFLTAGSSSCVGNRACRNTRATLGSHSCSGFIACSNSHLLKAGDYSCVGGGSCGKSVSLTVGDYSCFDYHACILTIGVVGHFSCIGSSSCQSPWVPSNNRKLYDTEEYKNIDIPDNCPRSDIRCEEWYNNPASLTCVDVNDPASYDSFEDALNPAACANSCGEGCAGIQFDPSNYFPPEIYNGVVKTPGRPGKCYKISRAAEASASCLFAREGSEDGVMVKHYFWPRA